MHYSMGGLWVDYDHMTNIPGLFAAGEVDYQYHGANRLGANSLLSCLYSGMVGGPNMVRYARGHDANGATDTAAEQEQRRQEAVYNRLRTMQGKENVYVLAKELGEWMTANVTVIRDNEKLRATDNKLLELQDRWANIGLHDQSGWANQELSFIKQLRSMLELARVITLGALQRDESRGAHYKPAFPERDDAKFLKTTKARWSSDGPEFSYEDVDAALIKPRPRKYDVDK
jgi:succinate dehydrogenase / fumarate reductase flavoprotein subunit